MTMNALTARLGAALAPSTYQEARDFAQMIANSDMVPKDYKGRPGNVMVAMQWGAEIGLGPLQAMQNIAVINGRPSIWGDAALALVRGHPACVAVREGVEGEGDARHGWCEVTRKGDQPQRRSFSIGDAKKAGLWGKAGPWQQYPDRMLQLRARGFAIRDVFPDALRGVITAEEAQDMPPEPAAAPLPPARGPVVDSRATAAAELTMLTPGAEVRNAPDCATWEKWCLASVARLATAQDVRAWERAMDEHFERAPAEAVERVRQAVSARLAPTDPDDDFPGVVTPREARDE
jgi:hypothetical protein